MNIKTIIAVILIAFGIVVLAYAGITYTTPGETIRFLGLRIETTDTHFIPPLAGVASLIAGVVLLLVKTKRLV